jgi:hypothetical protein
MPAPSFKGSRASRPHPAFAALLLTLPVLALALCFPPHSAADVPVAPAKFFGVDENIVGAADFDLMQQGNVGSFRTLFPFAAAKSERKQPYSWASFDDIVRQTADRGIELLPNLYGYPPWLSDKRASVPLKRDAAASEWAQYLTAVVQRYGPGGQFWAENPYTPYRPIGVWQIWNEPNSITWWAPKPDPEQYATLLERSAAAITAVDPAAQIMTAGIVARPTNAHAIKGVKYLTKLFRDHAAREATDLVGFHPFAATPNGVRSQLRSARRVLRRVGMGSAPIWITEVGWGSKGKRDKEHPLIKSERGQIAALQDTFAMALQEREKLGIGRLFWYHWRDSSDDLCKWCESSGLVTKKLVPKPLFDAFREIAVP